MSTSNDSALRDAEKVENSVTIGPTSTTSNLNPSESQEHVAVKDRRIAGFTDIFLMSKVLLLSFSQLLLFDFPRSGSRIIQCHD